MISRIPPRRSVWTSAGRQEDLHLAVFIIRRHCLLPHSTKTAAGGANIADEAWPCSRVYRTVSQAAKTPQRPTRLDHLEQHVDQAGAKQDRRDCVSTGGEKGSEVSRYTLGESSGRSLMAGGSTHPGVDGGKLTGQWP